MSLSCRWPFKINYLILYTVLTLWLYARPPRLQTSRVRPDIKENKPEKKKHLENITDVSNKLLNNIHIRAVINYNSGGP